MPHLVVLAAGLGTRFGGVKQLAPVGPHGEAIMDVLLGRAAAAGFDQGVVVVREGIEEAVVAHFAAQRPVLPVSLVVQPVQRDRDRPLGTAHAVLQCRNAVDGPFAVVNADDLYPASAFEALARELDSAIDHALVAFRLGQTVVSARAVSRAVLTLDERGDRVLDIEERVGLIPSIEDRDAWVSMNMWGFHPRVFEDLDAAVTAFVATDKAGEVLLPEVVAAIVHRGDLVRALRCDDRCIGITHPEDVDVVRGVLAAC